MDTVIKEVGITFLVGAITILGVELSLFYMLEITLTGFFSGSLGLRRKTRARDKNPTDAELQKDSAEKKDKEEKGKGKTQRAKARNEMSPYVFWGVSIVVGILVENISFFIVEDNSLPSKTSAVWLAEQIKEETRKKLKIELPDERNALRIRTLLPGYRRAKEGEAQTMPCGEGLAHAISPLVDGKRWPGVSDWLTRGGCPTEHGTTPNCIEDALLDVYYRGKNRVFRQPEYYEELRRIEQRMGFMRSAGMVFFVQGWLTFVLIAVAVARDILERRSTRNTSGIDAPAVGGATPKPIDGGPLGTKAARGMRVGASASLPVALTTAGIYPPQNVSWRLVGLAALCVCISGLAAWRRSHHPASGRAIRFLSVPWPWVGAAPLTLAAISLYQNGWETPAWAALTLISALAIVVDAGIRKCHKLAQKDDARRDDAQRNHDHPLRKRLIRHLSVGFGIFACLYALSAMVFWGYARESIEFTKRVFGYYASIEAHDLGHPAQAAAMNGTSPSSPTRELVSAGQSQPQTSIPEDDGSPWH